MALIGPLLALLVAAGGGSAAAAEYRRITVLDGRVLLAAVEDTTATGLSLRLPQGTTAVGFDQVSSIEELDPGTWAAQGPWQVVVVPPDATSLAAVPALQQELVAALQQVPALVVETPPQQARLTPAQQGALAACGAVTDCMQRWLDQTDATAAVSARVIGGEVRVVATWRGAPRARRTVSLTLPQPPQVPADPLRQAVETALHLDPRPVGMPTGAARPMPAPVEPSAVQPAAPSPASPQPAPQAPTAALPPPEPVDRPSGPTPAALRAAAWAPLPGLPSALRGQWGGFAASWALAVPGAAGFVAVAGEASFTREQLIATGVGGSWLLTVAINHAIGLRGLDAGAAVAPAPGGGAIVSVGGAL